MLQTWILVAFSFAALMWARRGLWQMALLSLPGTIAHELSHLLVGTLFFAKPSSLSIVPRREGNTLVLGSVSFRNVGLMNGMFVAFAPLLLAPVGYLSILQAMESLQSQHLAHWGLWSVLAGNLFFSAMPSWQDFRVGFPSLLMYSIVGVVGAGFMGWLPV